MDQIELGKTIAEYREKTGLNQTEFGKKAGLPQKTISRIENGVDKACLSTLDKIASALGMDLEIKFVKRKKP